VANYDDGRVACTNEELIIRHYYAPFGTKHIKYSAIREVHEVPLAFAKWRIQGSNDFIHWYSWDPRRPRKKTALVIYLDGAIKPVITPDDPGQVAAALAGHGVNVVGAAGTAQG
jgi:hypothetical protein